MIEPLRHPVPALPAESGCVIDCETCSVRGDACGDCVVTVMLGGPPDVVGADQARALAVLAEAGLVPWLRMTEGAPATPGRERASPPPGPAR